MRKLIFMLLPLALFAQNPPDARALLARADASIFTAKTVRLAATQARGFAGLDPLPGSPFKLEFVRGGRGRAEFRASLSNTIITLMVFDGANLWEYHDLGNQYTKKSAVAWTFQGEIATLDYGRKPNNISAASYENDETIVFNGLPVACYVVRAEYRAAPNNPFGKGVVRRSWISKVGELILRDYWEGPLTPGMTDRETVTTNYTTIETDVSLPEDLFAFQPPQGSKLGEPIVMGGVVGGLASESISAAPPPPPPPPPPPKKVEEQSDSSRRANVSGTEQQAKVIRRTTPVYPPLAKQARIQGVVRFRAIISKDGTIKDLSLISGHPLLAPAAMDAVKQWSYQPTTINGERVEVLTQIDVTFTLAQRSAAIAQ